MASARRSWSSGKYSPQLELVSPFYTSMPLEGCLICDMNSFVPLAMMTLLFIAFCTYVNFAMFAFIYLYICT